MRIITTRQELVDFAREYKVRADWHEPDEQGLTARVEGGTFDNAGFWPTAEAMRFIDRRLSRVELHVVISHTPEDECCEDCGHGEPVDMVAINLATLLAWATGHEG